MQDLEVELKFRIDPNQLDKLKISIEKLGYVSARWRVYEKNTMYDNPAQLMQLSDWRIRLRISWDQAEICYKKPIKDESGIKKEIEFETMVGDPATISKILNMMEFFEVSSYERYRTSYLNNTNWIKITIDEFPFDTFIEIEWWEEEIKEAASHLWLKFSENLTKPCDTLFNERRKERGLAETMIMSFDSYNQA